MSLFSNASQINVSTAQATRAKGLSMSQQMAYALPAISIGVLLNLMGVVQGIYAKYFGVALTTIAAVVLVVRLFDVYLIVNLREQAVEKRLFFVAVCYSLLVVISYLSH